MSLGEGWCLNLNLASRQLASLVRQAVPAFDRHHRRYQQGHHCLPTIGFRNDLGLRQSERAAWFDDPPSRDDAIAGRRRDKVDLVLGRQDARARRHEAQGRIARGRIRDRRDRADMNEAVLLRYRGVWRERDLNRTGRQADDRCAERSNKSLFGEARADASLECGILGLWRLTCYLSSAFCTVRAASASGLRPRPARQYP
jgi:hypothetical protein